jgi:hypothetical protein
MLDYEDVTKRDTPTEGGIQQLTYVNEYGICSLLFNDYKTTLDLNSLLTSISIRE